MKLLAIGGFVVLVLVWLTMLAVLYRSDGTTVTVVEPTPTPCTKFFEDEC